MLKVFSLTKLAKNKETLLSTYKAVSRTILEYLYYRVIYCIHNKHYKATNYTKHSTVNCNWLHTWHIQHRRGKNKYSTHIWNFAHHIYIHIFHLHTCVHTADRSRFVDEPQLWWTNPTHETCLQDFIAILGLLDAWENSLAGEHLHRWNL